MPKWIGGIFGNTIASNATFPLSGVFSSQNQYSIKQEGGWVLGQIQATGGTIIDSGGYRIHVFTSPGSFAVSLAPAEANTVEYLVVAGGGGGGADFGGGSGAGGFRTGTSFPVTTTVYPITVGGGGIGGLTTPGVYPGTNGSPSIFSSITSAGGGKGSVGSGPAPSYATGGASPGGSGGGGGGFYTPANGSVGTGNTPPTTPPQGNPGGFGFGNAPNLASCGGGGGGANAAGTNGVSTQGGPGGIGSPITWIPASYGTPGPAPGRYFAGGGGGGAYATGGGTGGSGGNGGGGPGGTVAGSSGTTGTNQD